MLLFCPSCSNTLTIARVPRTPDPSSTSTSAADAEIQNRFECRTCPYQFPLTRTYYERTPYHSGSSQSATHNNPDQDVHGGAAAWAHVDKTGVAGCPNERCGGTEAYFMQVQIRSADEPMTRFYRCVECGREWRE